MARYIDADELSRRMYHDAFETDSDMQRWDSGCWIRYKMFENAINDAPTADVVERKRGEWIDNETSYADDTRQTCTCSVCGRLSYRPLGSFCRWCGANMEGENK